MKNSFKNRINMHKAVLLTLQKNQVIWSSIPKIVSDVEELENSLSSLQMRTSLQSSITLGVSENMQRSFFQIADKMVGLQDTLWVYAKATNNFELLSRNSLSPSRTKRLGSSARLDRIKTLVDDLNEYGSAIEEYGVSQAAIAAFIDAVNAYKALAMSPRIAIISRKTITEEITMEMNRISEILKSLDRMIRTFHVSHASFVSAYFNSRIVVDLRGKRNKKGSPPIEPDDGF